MNQHKEDIIRSVIAIALCIVFLWTGKTFIWNKAQDPDIIPASDTEPDIDPIEPDPSYTEPFTPEPTETDLAATDTAFSEPAFAEPNGISDPSLTQPAEGSAAATTSAVPDDQATALDPAVVQSSTALSSTFTSTTTLGILTTSTSTAATTSTEANAPTSSKTTTTTTVSLTTTTTTATEKATPPPSGGFGAAPEGYFDDALFIGDSRLVGIGSFAPLGSASYFATTGLSTYKLNSATSEVKPNKGQTFAQVLGSKKFSKVYIVMGINELGYDLSKTMNNYRDLITKVRSANPGCMIYVNANLHVSAARSAKDKVVNNTKINKFNEGLRALTNGTDIVYLDVNPVFDDGNGNFDKQYTNDGTHPTAKNYKLWSEWLSNNVKL